MKKFLAFLRPGVRGEKIIPAIVFHLLLIVIYSPAWILFGRTHFRPVFFISLGVYLTAILLVGFWEDLKEICRDIKAFWVAIRQYWCLIILPSLRASRTILRGAWENFGRTSWLLIIGNLVAIVILTVIFNIITNDRFFPNSMIFFSLLVPIFEFFWAYGPGSGYKRK